MTFHGEQGYRPLADCVGVRRYFVGAAAKRERDRSPTTTIPTARVHCAALPPHPINADPSIFVRKRAEIQPNATLMRHRSQQVRGRAASAIRTPKKPCSANDPLLAKYALRSHQRHTTTYVHSRHPIRSRRPPIGRAFSLQTDWLPPLQASSRCGCFGCRTECLPGFRCCRNRNRIHSVLSDGASPIPGKSSIGDAFRS